MSEIPLNLEERLPNWLPIPGVEAGAAQRHYHVDEQDLYCKGEVTSFHARQGVGALKNDRGLLLSFDLKEIELHGERAHLSQGMRVGYDASRTSRGLRITRLKVYS